MIASELRKDECQATTPNGQGFRPSEGLRTALLCAIAALLGGLGWSGRPSLNYFALLYPFVYLHSRRRLDSLSTTFYYAAATWGVIPASHGFFRTGANPIQPLLIWISLVALSSVPWIPGGTLRLKRQPTNQQEALEWLVYFQRSHVFVDLGLMQVSTAEAQRRGISPMSLLDPCTNLRVGWQILEDAYKVEIASYGPGQTALEHAISIYNTGNSQQGIDNGYLGRVLAAARRLGIDANPRGLAR